MEIGGCMDNDELVKHWIDSAEIDQKAMNHLFEKEDFHWSLFMGHLVIEKLLKALYIQETNDQPPFIHNLSRIVQMAEMEMTETQLDFLDTITTFNIRARYDDYKQLFYKKCTRDYTAMWIQNIEELIVWIKEKLSI
jgi:HEPN domain-containing protein